jgi:hypothetical protein
MIHMMRVVSLGGCSDMLAYVHQTLAAEKELIKSLLSTKLYAVRRGCPTILSQSVTETG